MALDSIRHEAVLTFIRTINEADAAGHLAEDYARIANAYRHLLGMSIPVPQPYRVPSLIETYCRLGAMQAEIMIHNHAGIEAKALDMLVDFAISLYSSCFYCTESNGAKLGTLYPEMDDIQALLEDPDNAPIPDAHKALFAWARKFACRSWQLCPNDIDALRQVGLSDADIVHVIQKAGVQSWIMIMADGGGVPMEGEQLTGPVVGRSRESYHDAPEGLTADARDDNSIQERPPGEDFPRLSSGGAGPEYKQVADWAEKRYGFVPQLLKALSLHPEMLPVYRLGLELLERPQSERLSPRQHALVKALVSHLNRSTLDCHHPTTALESVGVKESELSWVRQDYTLGRWDDQTLLLLDLAAKVTRNAYKITAKDSEAFRQAGLGDEGYVEVICTSALQSSYDRIANALGVASPVVYSRIP